ncbi:hypothetical protein BU24DRAFT_36519 [Aaosphaeria arxii CBS 175.79]|uniref:Uncharacterized protein n=1 Tax=Aaosphaeria arxii CBS 175.79 TaxID=1450172 RepID=A0A6A5YBG7_9PLEO|nr:uncharacterized protein BU24DRAFT_36519 [Aaosphaeria arxii CBS 175.79]KAF2022051.1 hypothetical protein BU24DRAFT_36519 [Aaosphaeria arxii CBS 175.79]
MGAQRGAAPVSGQGLGRIRECSCLPNVTSPLGQWRREDFCIFRSVVRGSCRGAWQCQYCLLCETMIINVHYYQGDGVDDGMGDRMNKVKSFSCGERRALALGIGISNALLSRCSHRGGSWLGIYVCTRCLLLLSCVLHPFNCTFFVYACCCYIITLPLPFLSVYTRQVASYKDHQEPHRQFSPESLAPVKIHP